MGFEEWPDRPVTRSFWVRVLPKADVRQIDRYLFFGSYTQQEGFLLLEILSLKIQDRIQDRNGILTISI